MEALVSSCLEKERDQRCQTADEIFTALSSILESMGVTPIPRSERAAEPEAEAAPPRISTDDIDTVEGEATVFLAPEENAVPIEPVETAEPAEETPDSDATVMIQPEEAPVQLEVPLEQPQPEVPPAQSQAPKGRGRGRNACCGRRSPQPQSS